MARMYLLIATVIAIATAAAFAIPQAPTYGTHDNDRVVDFMCGYAAALADLTSDATLGDPCQRVLWLAIKAGVPRAHGTFRGE